MGDETKWMILSTGSAIAAAFLTRAIMRKGWEAGMHEEAPTNPAAAGVTWSHALMWGVLSGLAAGTMRMLARRGATSVWNRSTHRKAPVQ